MSQVPLAPPPPSKDPILDRWLWLLWRRLTQAGQILWGTIDTSGSNLTDIETRNHNDLQTIQGGTTDEYYHLTASEYTGTGTGDFVREQSPTILGQTVDYIDFDDAAVVTGQPGRLTWNAADGTLDLGMGYDNVTQQIGLEQFYHVKNQTGSTLMNGYAARAVGTVGNSGQLKAGYALADGSIAARYNLGILTMDILDGEDGYVTSFGLVRQINTTGVPFGELWADGDILYVSPTTPGYLTNVEPTAPHQKIIMAIVIRAASNGSVFVRPTTGQVLGDCHDVQTSSPADGDILSYVDADSRWVNKSLSVTDGLTKTDDGLAVTIELAAFVGDSGTGGVIGAVPAPAAGDGAVYKYLSADGTWRNPGTSGGITHNALDGLEGGLATGVFETTAFEPTAFQQGTVQYYHINFDQYNALNAGQTILETAIDTTLDDNANTVLVTASAKTITLPEAQPSRYGREWTIIQNCNGYIDIEPQPTDEILLAGGSDTIRLTQIGTNVTLRCVSLNQWAIT